MSTKDEILEQIEKTKVVLAESRDNLENNPEEYSAQLLVLSTENHLADLFRKLDTLEE